MLTNELLFAIIIFGIGIAVVFLFLGIIFFSIFVLNKIFKNDKIKIKPDKSAQQDTGELEEIAAITAALTFLRESRFRYASIPEKNIISKWNNL
jgi:Na+-transporting methylmalonyl-CoA/oxaloacetate decarboxylase gamma subunit